MSSLYAVLNDMMTDKMIGSPLYVPTVLKFGCPFVRFISSSAPLLFGVVMDEEVL